MAIKTVLFDMDGVLINSENLMNKSARMALKDWGIDAKPEDFIPYVGQGENRFIGCVAQDYGVPYDPAMKARAYEYFGEHVMEETFVPDDVLTVLHALKERGYKMAICTSTDSPKARHNLRAIGTDETFFDAFITGEMMTRLKPAPDIYLQGAKLCETSPEECIVVEDSPSGVKAAHAGNIPCAGIDSTFPETDLVEQSHPDYLIHRLTDLLVLLPDLHTSGQD